MKQVTNVLLGAATAFLAVALFSFSQQKTISNAELEKKGHRIVFQMTTPDTAAYRSLMRQINNVMAVWPNASFEVVAHNKGIGMLEVKKSNVQSAITALKSKGVVFVACEQTMKQQKLEKTDILPEAGYVHSGLVELVERQEQGWAYIKGGF